MGQPFTTTCSLATSSTYDTTGTVTKALASMLTYTQAKALYTSAGVWNEMSAYIKTQFEMKACGVKRNGFYDWLMASNKTGNSKLINVVRRDRGPSLLQPFIMGRQNSILNVDSWPITSGWPVTKTQTETTQYDEVGTYLNTLSLSGATRVIRVSYPSFMDSNWENDPGWFLERQNIYILNVLSGAAAHGQWKVIDAACPADNSYVDVSLASLNSYSTTTVDTTPTNGLVLIGINNVNDYEKFCGNQAAANPLKHVPFWFQDRRRVRQVDSEYLDTLKKLMADNAWLEEFQNTPIAEYNRNDEEQWQRQFVHAFLFNRPISSNQTLLNWASLDQITSYNTAASVDPNLGGKLQAVRANTVGMYEQLKACSMVKDLQNQPLNMNEFVDWCYNLYRARKSSGRVANTIDFNCDHDTAGIVEIGFINLAKQRYGDILKIDIETGTNEFGFYWRKFKVPQCPFSVALVVDDTFDDIAASFSAIDAGDGILGARGRFLMALDIGKGGSMYPSVLASNRKVHNTGELKQLAAVDKDFACVMEYPTIQTTLTSERDCFICECPKNSTWIEQVGLATPVVTGKTTPYENLY